MQQRDGENQALMTTIFDHVLGMLATRKHFRKDSVPACPGRVLEIQPRTASSAPLMSILQRLNFQRVPSENNFQAGQQIHQVGVED